MENLTYPIGKPPLGLNEEEVIQYFTTLVEDIKYIPSDFNPFNVKKSYKINTSKEALKKVYAFWSGYAQVSEDESIVISLAPSDFFTIKKGQFYKEIPFPIHVKLGRINSALTFPREVKSGDYLGDLIGEDLHIEFLDEYNYSLDPLFFLTFFQKNGLFGLYEYLPNPYTNGSIELPNLQIAYQKNPIQDNSPYLKLTGDSRGFTIYNAENELQAKHFSFLSNETITIELINSPSKGNLKITDISNVMYRTKATPKFITKNNNTNWAFNPNSDLKPYHKPYKTKPTNGKRTPSLPLVYKIEVTIGTTILSTQIKQDIKDIIRQEYVFHSKPFQTFNNPIPERKAIEFNNKRSKHFSANEIQKSNYNSKTENWVLNSTETLQVAEYIRWKYKTYIEDKRLAEEENFPNVKSFGLKINSGWRNPERNEVVEGAKRSNHQYGRALDLKSVHRKHINNNVHNANMMLALFKAGKIFYEELVKLNDVKNCKSVEILLERKSNALWKCVIQDGTVQEVKGGRFSTYVKDIDSNKSDLWNAGKYATHVHIAWSPSDPKIPLDLPEIVIEEKPTPPIEYRNIILIATEDAAVKEKDQLPLLHLSKDVADYLNANTNFQTDIIEVSSPIDFLEAINAFDTKLYKIKYFFSFSHGWKEGLVMKNFKRYTDEDREQFYFDNIHNQEVLDELNHLYGFDTSSNLSLETVPFEYGIDDNINIKTHIINNAAFLKMSDKMIQNIRKCFEEAEDVFLIGCNTQDRESNIDDGNTTIAKIFASYINKPVYGSEYLTYTFVAGKNEIDLPPPIGAFSGNTDSQSEFYWLRKSVTRNQEHDPKYITILVPGWGWKGFKEDLRDNYWLDILAPPRTSNLLEIYKQTNRKVYPIDGSYDIFILNENFKKKYNQELPLEE